MCAVWVVCVVCVVYVSAVWVVCTVWVVCMVWVVCTVWVVCMVWVVWVVCVVCGICYMYYLRGEKVKSLYLVRAGGLVGYLALLCIFLKGHLSSFTLNIHPLFLVLYVVTRPFHHWCDIVAES